MITINKLRISNDLKNIEVNVSTDTLNARFTRVFVWNSETFRDYSKVKDVSNLLIKSSNQEEILISAETLGVNLLNGLYFIEFRTDENPTPLDNGIIANQTLGVVANLFAYKECLLNKVSSLKISDCGQVDSECEDCNKNICLLNTLVNSLGNAILQGFIEEAAKIAKDIEDMCDVCHNCPDYENTKSFNGVGLGYQIINNEILIQDKEEENKCNPPLPSGTNEFIPTYIKHIPVFETQEGENPCSKYIPECYEEIAYFYLPGGVDNYSRYNRLYKEPNLNSVYQPINNAPTYFQVSNNPLKQGARTSEDIIILIPTEAGVNLRYYCCDCPR